MSIPKTWTEREYYFAEDGKGMEDTRQIEIAGLPLSKSDSINNSRMENQPDRIKLNPDWRKNFIQGYSWLTEAVNEHLSE